MRLVLRWALAAGVVGGAGAGRPAVALAAEDPAPLAWQVGFS